jgi:Zn-dependent protease
LESSLRIGKIMGIPIGVNYSWFIVFALVTLSLATGYFPARYPGWETAAYATLGVVTSLLFFGSVLAHELAHSAVALAWGVPVKSITLFIFGGVAHISREPDRPLSEFLIAIAGPISSLLLALAFGAVWLGGEALELAPMAGLGLYLGAINLSLAVFNMIPGFPLDGGRVFRSLVWGLTGNMNRATRWAANAGRLMSVLMMLGGGVMFILGNWASGLWLGFIGWFLGNAAGQAISQVRVREALEGFTAGDFAGNLCQPVHSNLSLDWVVRDYVVPEGQNCFLVTDGYDTEGVATLGQIRQVPRQRWGGTPIRQIMTPLSNLKPANAGESAYDVLERMMEDGLSLLPVTDGSRMIGLVGRERLMQFAQK